MAGPGPGGPPRRQACAAQPTAGPQLRFGSRLLSAGSGACLQHREGTKPHPTRLWRIREGGKGQVSGGTGRDPLNAGREQRLGDQRDPLHPPPSPGEIQGQNRLSASLEAKQSWAGTHHHPLPSISEHLLLREGLTEYTPGQGPWGAAGGEA